MDHHRLPFRETEKAESVPPHFTSHCYVWGETSFNVQSELPLCSCYNVIRLRVQLIILWWAVNASRLGRTSMHTELWWRNMVKNGHLEERGEIWYDNIMMVSWKWVMSLGSGESWLRVVFNGRLVKYIRGNNFTLLQTRTKYSFDTRLRASGSLIWPHSSGHSATTCLKVCTA
jgi:hypothetical protein